MLYTEAEKLQKRVHARLATLRTPREPLTVVILDDLATATVGLVTALNEWPNLVVIGYLASPIDNSHRAGIEQIVRLADIVLLDYDFFKHGFGVNGGHIGSWVADCNPHACIVRTSVRERGGSCNERFDLLGVKSSLDMDVALDLFVKTMNEVIRYVEKEKGI